MSNKISLIILAYNDSDTIKKCVESVLNQEGLGKYELEIIFVPNGCTDNTVQIGANALQRNEKINITHYTYPLEVGHRNKALNFGINKSAGDYIIYLNADCHLAKDSVYLLTKAISDGYVLAGCKDICTPENIKKDTLLSKYVFAYGVTQKDLYNPLPNGRCICFRKGLIESFPENIHSEDNWISLKVYKEHGLEKIAKTGEVYYQMPNNWTQLVSLFTRWAQGTKQVLNVFPDLQQPLNEITAKTFMLEEKELGIKNATKTLLDMGISNGQVQELFALHKTIRLIVEDNVNLLEKDLVNNDGTWTTDR